jgi:phosphoglycerol transferase MdoB-like AlkP superfamily enzyme
MIVMPEHGRNLKPNTIQDNNDWFAFDHDDANSRRIFSMMVGPGIEAGLRVGSEGNPVGDASDIVPTIADIFGIKQTVLDKGLLDSNARSLFDRI